MELVLFVVFVGLPVGADVGKCKRWRLFSGILFCFVFVLVLCMPPDW